MYVKLNASDTRAELQKKLPSCFSMLRKVSLTFILQRLPKFRTTLIAPDLPL